MESGLAVVDCHMSRGSGNGNGIDHKGDSKKNDRVDVDLGSIALRRKFSGDERPRNLPFDLRCPTPQNAATRSSALVASPLAYFFASSCPLA